MKLSFRTPTNGQNFRVLTVCFLKFSFFSNSVKGRNKNHGVSASKASRNRDFYGGRSEPLIGVMIEYALGPMQEKPKFFLHRCLAASEYVLIPYVQSK